MLNVIQINEIRLLHFLNLFKQDRISSRQDIISLIYYVRILNVSWECFNQSVAVGAAG